MTGRRREYIRKTQQIQFEPYQFIGYEWSRFEYKRSSFISTLPIGSHVYCILVNNSIGEKMVYIGCTKDLQCRFPSHTKLGSLYMNKKRRYNIFILFRQFSNNHDNNSHWERKLITEYNPALNRQNKSYKLFTETDMWNFLKVKKVDTGKDLMKKWMEEKRISSLKKTKPFIEKIILIVLLGVLQG